LAAVVLALGEYGPVAQLQRWLPWTHWFHFPCRYLVLFQFAVALLSAIGFVLLARESSQRWESARQDAEPRTRATVVTIWKKFEPLWALVLVSMAVAAAGLLLQWGQFVAPTPRVLVGPLLMATVAILMIAAAQGVREAMVVLIVLAAADLGYYGLSGTLAQSTDYGDTLCASAPEPDPGLAVAAQANRVFVPAADTADQPLGGRLTMAGWRRTDGRVTLEPRRELDYYNLPALRVSATRWVRRTPATEAIAGLIPHDGDWLEVPRPLPRVRLVSQTVTSSDPAHDIQRIDVDHCALCEQPMTLPPSTPGEATLLEEHPGRITVGVHCPSAQLLVVAESFHAGWHCSVDGASRLVQRVDGDLMGCLVEPGESTVSFEFRPASLTYGWLISIVGLGLIGCLFMAKCPRP
jgi:hypothetical protein